MNLLILISSLSFGGAEKQAILDANMLSKQHNVWLVYFNKGTLKNKLSSRVNVFQFTKKRCGIYAGQRRNFNLHSAS